MQAYSLGLGFKDKVRVHVRDRIGIKVNIKLGVAPEM